MDVSPKLIIRWVPFTVKLRYSTTTRSVNVAGMLVKLKVLVDEPLRVLLVVAIIVVGTFFQQVLVIANTTRKLEFALMEAALEAGAEDVIVDDEGGFEVITDPHEFSRIREALEKAAASGTQKVQVAA